MSVLSIYKASAGSGKTWQLTYEYLRVVLPASNEYRRILAVTFTNKSTEEMKQRILRELSMLATGVHTPMGEKLLADLKITPEELIRRSSRILRLLLHDYSRFSISTIDSFFQRILRSFARDAGIPFTAELELDSEKILTETTDQLFFELNRYPFLRKWLVQMTLDRIREGGSWDIRKDINDLGREIIKENYFRICSPDTLNDNRDILQQEENFLRKQQHSLESILREAGEKAIHYIHSIGLSTDDFANKSRGIIGYFQKLANGSVPLPTPANRQALSDDTKWVTKNSGKADLIRNAVDTNLRPWLAESFQYYRDYQTFDSILRWFHVGGILDDLAVLMRDYASEKNIYLLSETPGLLGALIGSNDAPFIYERAGNTWLYYMIDEFQDTSVQQWNNFKPLVKNSISQGKPCLVVGDVKQSIYRWRNGDWQILAHNLEDEFGDQCTVHNLQTNFRSKPAIIRFNNAFFGKASDLLQEEFNHSLDDVSDISNGHWKNQIIDAYAGHIQEIPEGNTGEGLVQVEICPDDSEGESIFYPRITEQIRKLLKEGYHQRDIAILVRYNSQAQAIASYLLDPASSPPGPAPLEVISEEAILLMNAPVIRVLTALLRYLYTPGDTVNNIVLASELCRYIGYVPPEGNAFPPLPADENAMASFLPPGFITAIPELRLMPVHLLCGRLVMMFSLHKHPGQLLYIHAFMDRVMQSVRDGVTDLLSFLNYWSNEGPSFSVTIPEQHDAIRVMTIHKAKGLEFPVIILAGADWSLDHEPKHSDFLWCKTEKYKEALPGIYPVKYNKQLLQTDFAEAYLKEKVQTYVDNLNLIYVAFTRAKEILSVYLTQEKGDGIKKASSLIANSLSKLDITGMQTFQDGDTATFTFGTASKKKENHEGIPRDEMPPEWHEPPAQFPEWPGLVVQEKSKEFFSDPEKNKTQVRKNEGILMHEILSQINTANDLEKAIQQVVFEGKVSQEEGSALLEKLRILTGEPGVQEWYSGIWTVRNETDIICPGGGTRRPDRIMIRGKKVLVVDYKFGILQEPYYHKQVKDYLILLQKAGFQDPSGIIWYVTLGIREKVALA